MKVVCISDTHWAPVHKLNIPDGDMLICAGDHSMTGELVEIVKFAQELEELKKFHCFKYVLIVPGNHDRAFESCEDVARQIMSDYGHHHVLINQSYHTSYDSDVIKVYGSPVQPTWANWAFQYPRLSQELTDNWSLIPDSTDILITHGPPYGILDIAHNMHLGDETLIRAVMRVEPKFHVFGHIHEGAGVYQLPDNSTMFINAAMLDGNYKYDGREAISFEI